MVLQGSKVEDVDMWTPNEAHISKAMKIMLRPSFAFVMRNTVLHRTSIAGLHPVGCNLKKQ